MLNILISKLSLFLGQRPARQQRNTDRAVHDSTVKGVLELLTQQTRPVIEVLTAVLLGSQLRQKGAER